MRHSTIVRAVMASSKVDLDELVWMIVSAIDQKIELLLQENYAFQL